MIDQLVISGASFFSLMLVARFLSLSEVGTYVLAMSVILIVMAFQDALITRPYTVKLMKPQGTVQEHAGSALLLSLILSVILACIGIFLDVLLYLWPNHEAEGKIGFALACVAPLLLAREFARRHSFSALQSRRALILDLIVVAITMIVLYALGRLGALSPPRAILAMGFGALVGVPIWWMRHREEFAFNKASVKATAADNWKLGRWFAISQMSIQIGSYANHWLSLILLSIAATGIYAEAMAIVALVNPFIYGILNFLMPKMVRVLHDEGRQSLLKHVRRYSMFMAILMSSFTLFIIFFGNDARELVFKHPVSAESVDIQLLMTLLSIGVLIGATGAPGTLALQTEERGHELALATLVTCVFAFVSSFALISIYGLFGAGLAFVLMEIFGISYRSWLLFVRQRPLNHG
jgi:O-antigen/teichoic acid export membrane protein